MIDITPYYTGTYPQVLEVFKILIEFIWNVISHPIHLGNNFTVTIFGIMAFVIILVTLLKMFQLKIPRFKVGWDSYGKFSTTRSNVIKKNKKG